MIPVSIAHENFTHQKIKESSCFGFNLISSEGKRNALNFATRSGKHFTEVEGVAFGYSYYGNLILRTGIVVFLDCNVVYNLRAGEHTLLLAEVLDGVIGADEEPLLYYRKQFMRIQES